MPKKSTVPDDQKETIHLVKLVPNMVTLLGLCIGLSSIKFAHSATEHIGTELYTTYWEKALYCVIIAAVIDGVDGLLARLLNATSKFGAQLDSLCDVINFGVVPSMLFFFYAGQHVPKYGWACALFFTVCCIIRLARFNSMLEDKSTRPAWYGRFLMGVPAPAGGLLAMFPPGLELALKEDLHGSLGMWEWVVNPYFACIYCTVIAGLMVSKTPTITLKWMRFAPKHAPTLLLIGAVFVIFALTKPWLTITIIGLWYLCTIIYSVIQYFRLYHGQD